MTPEPSDALSATTRTDDSEPPRGSSGLSLGVIIWADDTTVDPTVIVGHSAASLARVVATTIHDEMTSDSDSYAGATEFLNSNPPPQDWATPEDVDHWLEALREATPHPAITFYQIPTPGGPDGIGGTVVATRHMDGTAQELLSHTLMGEVQDSQVEAAQEAKIRTVAVPSPEWESFDGSGIPEIVAEMFPLEPHPDNFRLLDGSPDTEGFEDAHDLWRDACLSLALQASRLPDTLERLRVTERVRDGLIDLLEREPLPLEPKKDDYLVVVAPAYEGEYEDARYRWDRSQWRTDFTDTARRREQALQGLLVEGGPRTMFLPERFHREWVPSDLLAIQTLREVIEREHAGRGYPLLDRAQREQLESMLFAADAEVAIPDPIDPAAPPIYEGPASEAHAWIRPGVYDATGSDGQGEFRVVVGRAPIGDSVTASAAFPPAEHDSAVLNEVARLLEQYADNPDPMVGLERVNTLVLSTGRMGAPPASPSAAAMQSPLTRLERGVLLSDLLADRGQQLDPDHDGPERPTTEPGPRRNL